MAFWIVNYVLSLMVAILASGLIIPNIIHIAFRKKLFDSVNERKVHRGVVPRLGGIAFLPSIIFASALVFGSNVQLGYHSMADYLADSAVPLLFLLCAITMMYVVGIADDLVGVRYRMKFIFQILAGCLIMCSGLRIDNMFGFLWIDNLSPWIGVAFSVFLVVFVINAINLIDGIDGLASGLSAIALIFYSYIFFVSGRYVYALIAAATLGTLIPFFFFNVFGNAEKATKIFMGDTGALSIGVILSFLSLTIFSIPQSLTLPEHPNLFIMAIAPLILPCFDVVRVFMHRVRYHRNPFLPDKSHIHHKLLALGMKPRSALVTILIMDALFIVVDLGLAPLVQPTWLFAGNVLLWTLINIWLTRRIRRLEIREGVTLYR